MVYFVCIGRHSFASVLSMMNNLTILLPFVETKGTSNIAHITQACALMWLSARLSPRRPYSGRPHEEAVYCYTLCHSVALTTIARYCVFYSEVTGHAALDCSHRRTRTCMCVFWCARSQLFREFLCCSF